MAKAIFNETYMKFSVSDIFNSNPPSYPPLARIKFAIAPNSPKEQIFSSNIVTFRFKNNLLTSFRPNIHRFKKTQPPYYQPLTQLIHK